MEILKNWISDICVSILFMTTVELILPENSIKKYSKFVLGLIFIVVVINPVIEFIKNDSNLYKDITLNEDYINKFDNYIENNLDEYTERIKKTTLENFKKSFTQNCENLLKSIFKTNDFKVTANVSYKNGDFNIDRLQVVVEEDGIKKIEDIDINKVQTVFKENAKASEIKKFLAKELQISQSVISVY